MNFNWVDWIIIAVGAYYIFKGWEEGLFRLATKLVAFLASLWLAIKYHVIVGQFLVNKFGVPVIWGTVLGYGVLGLGTEIIMREIIII